MKKTNTIKSESCPKFCQSFHFKVQDSLMDITSLSVAVFQVKSPVVLYSLSDWDLQSKSLLEKDKLIGSCNLGGSMFARGKGEEHWQQVLRFTKQVSAENG